MAKPENNTAYGMELLLTLTTLGAALVQGGYFPTMFLFAAFATACGLLFTRRPAALGQTWWAWALAGWYLCAALRWGYRADSLAQAFLPACCALFFTACRSLSEADRARYFNHILLGGGALAGLSLLAFSGVLPLNGAVTAHRLQGTFQYANAAGSWFAAMALLAQDCLDARCRKLTMVNITALFLTRSTGALGLYAVMQILRAFLRRKEGVWADCVLLHAAALAFAAFLFLIPGWPALPALVLLGLLSRHWARLSALGKRFHLQWACLILGIAATAGILASRRFAVSLGTFVERIVQMKDGLGVILHHPAFGLGAGSWALLAPYYQSAQYSASVIHSSPVLIGVDAGLPAVVLAAGLVISSWRRGRRSLSQNLAAVLLILHSIFDFTMRFYPLAVLLLALLSTGTEASELQAPRQKGIPLRRAVAAVCALLGLWLLAGELETKQLNARVNTGDWAGAAAYYEDRRWLFGDSRKARAAHLYALYGAENWQGILNSTQGAQDLSLDELNLRAQAMEALGDQEGACTFLLEQLEQRLYQVELFQRTAELFRLWEVDGDTVDTYNRLVEQANGSQTFLGTLKGDQVYIDKLDLGGNKT